MIAARHAVGAAAMVAAALVYFPSAYAATARRATPIDATARPAESTLAVWDGTAWRSWWSASAAPDRWTAQHRTVAAAVEWRRAHAGLEVGAVRFAGGNRAARFNVALLRLDPAHVSLRPATKRSPSGRTLPWSIADMPEDALVVLNAGMFDVAGPWGWLVVDGNEQQPPGTGSISSAVVADSAGRVRIVHATAIAAARASGTVRWAVQSYPTALVSGVVPNQLRAGSATVDLGHRDARLAIATLRDGRILLALTRFDGLGGALAGIPLGPTLPEMTAVLGALGAHDAVFLDGGLSAQMAVRHADSRVESWEGMRRVPLWFAGYARQDGSVFD